MAYRIVFFVALLATAMALGAAIAHALELPNKIALPADQYFIVQKAYRGWNQLAYVLAVQLIALVALAIMSRHANQAFWLVIIAVACLVAAQIVFWTYTYPANVATENWTVVPANWEALRERWEYSHAAGALLQLLGMCSLFVAALGQSGLPVRA